MSPPVLQRGIRGLEGSEEGRREGEDSVPRQPLEEEVQRGRNLKEKVGRGGRAEKKEPREKARGKHHGASDIGAPVRPQSPPLRKRRRMPKTAKGGRQHWLKERGELYQVQLQKIRPAGTHDYSE